MNFLNERSLDSVVLHQHTLNYVDKELKKKLIPFHNQFKVPLYSPFTVFLPINIQFSLNILEDLKCYYGENVGLNDIHSHITSELNYYSNSLKHRFFHFWTVFLGKISPQQTARCRVHFNLNGVADAEIQGAIWSIFLFRNPKNEKQWIAYRLVIHDTIVNQAALDREIEIIKNLSVSCAYYCKTVYNL